MAVPDAVRVEMHETDPAILGTKTADDDITRLSYVLEDTGDYLYVTTGLNSALRSTSVKHDTVTEPATFTTTSPFNFTHTPTNIPRGVLVLIDHGTVSTDLITSVTYGGTAMTRLVTGADASGEPGRVYIYFLGSSVPTGAQTVAITHTGSMDVKHAVCVSVTCDRDVVAMDPLQTSGDLANPQLTPDSSFREGLRYSVIYSGNASVSDVVPLENMSPVADHDYGSFVSRVDRNTVPEVGNKTVGYSQAADDTAMAAVALAEGGDLEIWDLTTPSSPVFLKNVTALDGKLGNRSRHALVTSSTGDHLYVSDGDTKLYTLDITTPTSPSLVDTLTGVGSAGEFHVINRVGSNLYLLAENGQVLRRISIATESAPSISATLSGITSIPEDTQVGWLTPDDKWIFYPSSTGAEGTIARVDIDGTMSEGSAIQLPLAESGGPQIRPGDYLAFKDANTLYMLAFYAASNTLDGNNVWLVYGKSADWGTVTLDSHTETSVPAVPATGTSARIIGTNEQIKTYGTAGAGRDYTALSTWESDTDTDHVTDAETDVLECYDDAASFDDQVDMSGSTNNSTYFRIVRPASGQGHNGTPASGVYFKLLTAGFGRIFLITETNSSVQDMLFTIASSSSGTFSCGETATGASDSSFIACIAYDNLNSGSGLARGFQHKGSDAILALCLAHNGDTHGYESKDNTVYAYNCVSHDNAGRGYNHSSGTFVTKNCIGDNNTTEDWDTGGTWTGSSNNASSDGTAQGTSARINQTFTYVNAASDDFHLAAGDAGAKDFGTDLSADSTFAFDEDIDDEVFKTWDIGFDENDPKLDVPTSSFIDPKLVKTLTTDKFNLQRVNVPGTVALVRGKSSDSFIYTFLRDDENAFKGYLTVWDFGPSGTRALPRQLSAIRISDAATMGFLERNSDGQLFGFGLNTALSASILAALTEPTGTWTDLGIYTHADSGIDLSYGISGVSPSDRVADTGTLSFQLDNSQFSAKALLGTFSPDHANLLTSFRVGREIRLAIDWDSGTHYHFYGHIESITPDPGQYLGRRTNVICVDFMDRLARAQVKRLGVHTSIRSVDVAGLITNEINADPPETTVDPVGGLTARTSADYDQYPFALDHLRDERASVVGEVQNLVQSERAFVYMAKDSLVFEARNIRAEIAADPASTSPVNPHLTATDDEIVGMAVEHTADNVVNFAQGRVYPREEDSSNVTLFNLEYAPEIFRNTTLVIDAPYRDPDSKASRVGSQSLVAPAATTDYTFNTASDGTGTDITSQITVTPSFGGNSAKLTIKNAGPLDGFLTLMKIRGKGLYSYEPITAIATDELSRDLHGPVSMTYEMRYHREATLAEDAAQYFVSRFKNPQTFIRSISVQPNKSNALMDAVVKNLTISSLIRVTETVTGLSAEDYFVNNVQMNIRDKKFITATYGLTKADTAAVWELGTAGATELGTTTVLGSSFAT